MSFSIKYCQVYSEQISKDIKELTPVLLRVKQEYLRFPSLSNDELRAESALLKAKINNSIKAKRMKLLC